MLSIVRRYEMEVAHQLHAGVPEGHKCRRLHGHRYVLEIEVSGELDESGMIIEYGDLDRLVKSITHLVDHHDLNDIQRRCSTKEALQLAANPTVERLAIWIRVRLEQLIENLRQGLKLRRLLLEEDSRSAAHLWVP